MKIMNNDHPKYFQNSERETANQISLAYDFTTLHKIYSLDIAAHLEKPHLP